MNQQNKSNAPQSNEANQPNSTFADPLQNSVTKKKVNSQSEEPEEYRLLLPFFFPDKFRLAAENLRSKKGFTLLEIMVVIILVGILGTVVGESIVKSFVEGQRGTAKIQVCHLEKMLDAYKIRKGQYPSHSNGIQALSDNHDLGSQKQLKDPWGTLYMYRYPGLKNPNKPDVYSLGSDKKEGGSGMGKDIWCTK